MSIVRFFGVFMAGCAMNLASWAVQAEESRSMLDGDLLAAEVGVVDLVMNASGEVVQVRVDDCEQCDREAYLPSRRLRVTQSGNPAFSGSLTEVDGQPGTVVLNRQTGMVEKIIFWAPRDEGSEQ